MKRRVVSIVLAMGMAVAMTACGGQTASTSNNGTTEAASGEASTSAEEAVTESAAVAATEGATVAAAEEETFSEALGNTLESIDGLAAEGSTEAAATGSSETAALFNGGGLVQPPAADEEGAERAGSSEDSASDAMIGEYVSQGYRNSVFGFKVDLPYSYTLQSRSLFTPADGDIVSVANDSDTYDWIRSNLSLGAAPAVFSANNGTTELTVYLEGLGFAYDHWESEETVAENSMAAVESGLKEALDDSASVTDFNYEVDLTNVAGQLHYTGFFACNINGATYCGYEVFMRADDGEHFMFICGQGWDMEEVARTADDYIQAY